MTVGDLSQTSAQPQQSGITENRKSKIENIVSGFVIWVVTLVLFALTRFGNFMSEDVTLLGQLRGPKQTIGDTLGFFFGDWGLGGKYYAPLPRLLFYFEYKFFQTNAASWHIISALLHSVAALLVWWLAWKLLHRSWFAFLAGLFFALQPLHVTVVAQAVSQAEILALIFCLASAVCFVTARQRTGQANSRLPYILAVVFYGIALLCKETALPLPLALLAYDFITGGMDRILKQESEAELANDRRPSLLTYYLPFLALVVVYLVMSFALLGGLSAYFPTGQGQPDLTISSEVLPNQDALTGQRSDLNNFLRGGLRSLAHPFGLGGTDGLILLAALAAFLALTGVQEWEAWLLSHPQTNQNAPGEPAEPEQDDDEMDELPANPLDTLPISYAPGLPKEETPDSPPSLSAALDSIQPARVEPTAADADANPPVEPTPVVAPALAPVPAAPVEPPSYWTLRVIGFGFLWTVAFLLPFVLTQPTDRTLYLASAGFAIFLAAVLTPLGSNIVSPEVDRHHARALFGPFELSFWLRLVAIVAVVAAYFATSVQDIEDWNKASKPFAALVRGWLGWF